MPTVLHVRAFRDNYIWLIQGDTGPQIAVVDPGDAEPVLAFLQQHQLAPVAVLCTHHHDDHVGGVVELCRRYPVPVYGPDGGIIPGVTHRLHDDELVAIPEIGVQFRTLAIPGHTLDHIAYYGANVLFCGDTLFSIGCGRLFEGTAQQMFRSLARLMELPQETRVYCGHEYTLANLRFALAVDPGHEPALEYQRAIEARLNQGQPSLPSTVGQEKKINPFLRVGEPTIREAIERHTGIRPKDDVEAFAALRRWKDGFPG